MYQKQSKIIYERTDDDQEEKRKYHQQKDSASVRAYQVHHIFHRIKSD